VPFQGEVDHGVEQRVAWADEGGHGLARGCNEGLFKGDPLVAREHRLAAPDLPITLPHDRRDVRHLVAPWLPRPDASSKPAEGLQEEGLDVVG